MQFYSVEISSSVASDVGTFDFGVSIFVNLPLDLHLQLPTTLKLPTALQPPLRYNDSRCLCHDQHGDIFTVAALWTFAAQPELVSK
jgi:hypothetical protein